MTDLDIYRPQGELTLAASTAMERAADFSTWAPKLTSAAAIAQEICQTDFVPAALRGKPAAVTAAIMAGSEMNLGPMASLMHVHIIDGRPSLSAEMQRALVLALGHHIRYREMTVTRCVVDGQRRGDTEWMTVAWTMDDAKRAGLEGRQNWRKYPRRMLAARATGELCRMLFADALAGMPYSAEELEDEADDTATVNGTTPPAAQPAPRTARRRQAAPQTASPAEPQSRAADAQTPPAPAAGEAPMPPLPGEEDPGRPPRDWDAPPPEAGREHGDTPRRAAGPDETDYDSPGTASGPQLTAIWTNFTTAFKFGNDEKEQARAVCAHIIGRPVTSTKDMSHNEARTVLDTLGNWREVAERNKTAPREFLIELMATAGSEATDA